jgi:oxygen-dependent protoporphyrinogen oxidase
LFFSNKSPLLAIVKHLLFEYFYLNFEKNVMGQKFVIIGAGLTGLSTAFFLKRRGYDVLVLEKENRVGGAIRSHSENGFVFEEGPNTGVIGNPEIAELFEYLGIEPEIANDKAEKRLILKNNQWYPLPSGAISFFKTPLFTIKDKIGIAFEPLKKKGTNPEESVASLAARRIGKSFVDYAVNPFISGIYAGDPEKLITKYALPKLYNLEQNYGSFIGGSFKKSREPKSERDKKATRKVFSVKGGLQSLIDKLEYEIGKDNIVCNAKDIHISKSENLFNISYIQNGEVHKIETPEVISTIGAHDIPEVFTFLKKNDLETISNVNYAKVVQVAVGVNKEAIKPEYYSFGGLIPQKENKKLLGVLFPSFCFNDRAPENHVTLAIYLGGIKHPEYFEMSDNETEALVKSELKDLLNISDSDIQFIKIFRHPYAIPQYEKSSKERFETVERIEKENPGLIIAGNLRNGIGMADRVKQAYDIAQQIS